MEVVLHDTGKLEPVQPARHVDVRHQNADVLALFQNDQGVIRRRCFDYLKAGLFQDVDGQSPDERLVFHDEDGVRVLS